MIIYLLHVDSSANGNEVKASIVGEVGAGHLAQQSAVCIICTPVQRGKTYYSFLSIHVDDQRYSGITFEAKLLSLFPIPCTNARSVENSDGR